MLDSVLLARLYDWIGGVVAPTVLPDAGPIASLFSVTWSVPDPVGVLNLTACRLSVGLTIPLVVAVVGIDLASERASAVSRG